MLLDYTFRETSEQRNDGKNGQTVRLANTNVNRVCAKVTHHLIIGIKGLNNVSGVYKAIWRCTAAYPGAVIGG